ncbi:granulocyte-macrophage colony-stimulating factor receptor subunit alpha-like isoform X2 [Manis javanica]|uniref:granulocyte-macrophage colony-stimulating factor receptor subunit alpha-like isoform X2 n=1 Tax=Manis javanica TaxID=9974 RepID=UPI003C6D130B
MAAVLHFTTFLVLLSSACCRDPQLVQEDTSPIINMKLDSRTRMLTWNYVRNVTEQECRLDTPQGSPTMQSPRVKENNTYFCVFSNSVLHRGATLTLNVTSAGTAFQDVLNFTNPGKEGSSAVNFSCFIYDVRFMNCSWTPGPAAPADVQYHLYAWASTNEDEAECPHYTTDSTGTRVGCHFHKLGKPKRTDNYFFLVNGTSRETAVQFLDFTPFVAYKIEKYNPPENITVYDNESHHIIQWDNPEIRFDIATHMLYYKLDIQKKIFQRGEDKNVYLLPSSAMRAESTFRARVRYVHNKLWSEWSSPLHFGHAELRSSRTTAALAGLVAGVVLTVTVLMFLCKRFSLKQRLLPPIPQVRREVTGSLPPHLEVSWDGDSPPPGSHKPEDILLVEETQ